MNKLKVEVSSHGIQPDTVLIDGGRMLPKIYWPTDGLVKYMLVGAGRYIRKIIPKSNVL